LNDPVSGCCKYGLLPATYDIPEALSEAAGYHQGKFQSPQVMLVLATTEGLTKLRLLPPSCRRKFIETFLDGHVLGHRTWPRSTSRCLNPFDDAERIPKSTCRKILGLGHDASTVGLGLRYDALGGLGLDASAVGLGLGLGLGAASELRIGLDVPVGGLSIGLDASTGPTRPRLLNRTRPGESWQFRRKFFSMHEQTTNLRKRPQAVTHRIWVEAKPMDSADQVSYREAIVGLRLGRSGLMLLERSFDLCQFLLRYVDDYDCPRHRSPDSLFPSA